MLVLLAITGFRSSSGRETTRTSSEARLATIIFTDDTTNNVFVKLGRLETFGSSSESSYSGKVYEPFESVGTCLQTSQSNFTVSRPLPEQPFIVLLPDTSDCSVYTQAQVAQEMGASGIVFYSSFSNPSQLTSEHYSTLSLVVAMVTLSEEGIDSIRQSLNWESATIIIRTSEHSPNRNTHQLMYYVVFVFATLILLVLTWFIIFYSHRCKEHLTSKRNKVRL